MSSAIERLALPRQPFIAFASFCTFLQFWHFNQKKFADLGTIYGITAWRTFSIELATQSELTARLSLIPYMVPLVKTKKKTRG
jgi:hypothetical protein